MTPAGGCRPSHSPWSTWTISHSPCMVCTNVCVCVCVCVFMGVRSCVRACAGRTQHVSCPQKRGPCPQPRRSPALNIVAHLPTQAPASHTEALIARARAGAGEGVRVGWEGPGCNARGLHVLC